MSGSRIGYDSPNAMPNFRGMGRINRALAGISVIQER